MTKCSKQLAFPFFSSAKLVAAFDADEIVTDPGLLLIRQLDEKIQFTESISKVIADPRNPFLIQHPQVELLRQRIYQIIAGYEDCNDATVLRHDSIFKAISGRTPEKDPIGSQPTLCRLENRVQGHTFREIVETLVRAFIATRPEPLKRITLEMDPSAFSTYGHQQLTFFNGHYDTYMYFPMFLCDAESGFLLAPMLRRGNAPPVEGALITLAHVVSLLRAAWPDITIDFRADASFAEPNLLNWLDEERIPYAIGVASNPVLKRLSSEFVQSVEATYARTQQPLRSFTSIRYAAGTWAAPRRIVVKVEVTALGTNVRYVIVTRCGRSTFLYDWFVQRGGTIENYLEQLKNGFEGDRLSCRTFEANHFRLLMHCAAYNLMILFREQCGVPEIRTADIHTLRRKIIKVGALVKRTVRRVWIHMSATSPFASLFRQVHAALVPGPSG